MNKLTNHTDSGTPRTPPVDYMMVMYLVDGEERKPCHLRVVAKFSYDALERENAELREQLAAERGRVVELADNVKVRGDALVGAIDPDLAAIGEHYIGLADEIFALADPQQAEQETALQEYDRLMAGIEERSPVERLRFFLSLALKPQDWLDVEQFIDAIPVQQSATGEKP